MKKHLLVICLALLTFAVQGAKAETYSGVDGNITWSLDTSTGVLTLSGEGSMKDYWCNEVTSAPWGAYYTDIKEVVIQSGVTSIGNYAFYGCSSLASVTIPEGVTSIGNYAFEGCSSLTSVTIPDGVTSIGLSAFRSCSSLTSVTIPEGVTSIAGSTFRDCSSLTSVTIPYNVTVAAFPSNSANCSFGSCNLKVINITGEGIPTYNPKYISTNGFFFIPSGMYEAYAADENWGAYNKQIISADMLELRTVEVTAKVGVSAIDEQIGEANRLYVANLKVKGTINDYDLFAIRSKYIHLLDLDLSEAYLVPAGDGFEYYTGKRLTEADQLGDCAFRDLNILRSVTLPATLKSIGREAFYGCSRLETMELPDGVTTMGQNAFDNCSSLQSIDFGSSLRAVPYFAFYDCKELTSITLPASVTSIEGYAFSGCSKLASVVLPPRLESIGGSAFSRCSSLTELRIPSAVHTIGDNAFIGCPLKDVYTYIVEPQQINQNTFSAYTTAMLHVPSTSWALYDYNTQWGQFVNKTYFDEPYEYFYIDHDYMLDDNTGRIDGDPDAELNEHSGLIVEGDDEQGLGEIDINHDGTDGPSIIGDDNITAESMKVNVVLKGRSWKFFCFPFDIEYSDITLVPDNDKFAGDFVMYTYDGSQRASGESGWVRVAPTETLTAGKGYIIQGSTNGTLQITVDGSALDFSADDKVTDMATHAAADDADASWNFLGNPYLCYYDLDALAEQFDSPLTVWDGSQYLTYRPGDDNYQLHPFEAFFVQKPEKLPNVQFKGNNRITYTGAQNAKAAAQQRRQHESAGERTRSLVNLTLTDGRTTDRTRVVFNEEATLEYELACDAAKFERLTAVPQLWTIGGATRYAINERPTADGAVALGYEAIEAGTLVIGVARMDADVVLVDRATGTEHDFRNGDYTFLTEAGTFTDRFVIRRAHATAIDEMKATDADSEYYTTGGQRTSDVQGQGVVIVRKGDKAVKTVSK
mgnify:CR=1 FL=1